MVSKWCRCSDSSGSSNSSIFEILELYSFELNMVLLCSFFELVFWGINLYLEYFFAWSFIDITRSDLIICFSIYSLINDCTGSSTYKLSDGFLVPSKICLTRAVSTVLTTFSFWSRLFKINGWSFYLLKSIKKSSGADMTGRCIKKSETALDTDSSSSLISLGLILLCDTLVCNCLPAMYLAYL